MNKLIVSVLTVVLCGIWALSATALEPLSDADAKEMIAIFRRQLKDPKAPLRLDSVTSARLKHKEEVDIAVTAFADEAPPMGVRVHSTTLAEAASGAAVGLVGDGTAGHPGMPSALFYGVDRSDELAVVMEVGLGRRKLWPLAVPVPGKPLEIGAFEPGTDALLLEYKPSANAKQGPAEFFLGTTATVTGSESNPQKILGTIGGQITVGGTQEEGFKTLAETANWDPKTVTLVGIRMVQFAQGKAGSPLVWMHRLSIPVTRVGKADIERALVRGADFIVRLQQPKEPALPKGQFKREGLVIERYGATIKGVQPLETVSPRTQSQALRALSRAYRLGRKPEHRDAAEKLAEAVARLAEADGKLYYFNRTITGKKEIGDTLTTALVALDLVECPETSGKKELLTGMGEFLMSMRLEGGRFAEGTDPTLKHPLPADKSVTVPAALALWELGRGLGKKEFTDAALEAAGPILKERLAQLEAKKPIPLGQELEAVLFINLATVKPECRKLLEVTARQLLPIQISAKTAPSPDAIGTFEYKLRIGGLDYSARHVSACIEMLAAATASGKQDNQEITAHQQGLAGAVRFLLQLQIEQEEAFYCPNPEGAIGGFRRDLVSTDIWLREMGQAMAALTDALETVGEKTWEFPEAGAPVWK